MVSCSTHPYNTHTREESYARDIQHTTYFEGFTCHPQLQIYDGATLFRRPDAVFTFTRGTHHESTTCVVPTVFMISL